MKPAAISLVLVTLAVAFVGGWLGVRMGERKSETNLGLDQVLHHDLSLSSSQEQRIESLEKSFSTQRQSLESQMRAANRELAHAIVTDHQISPEAEQAITHFHEAMRQLQELTTAHVLGMRAVLTPDQAKVFDRTVVQVLNAEQP